MTCILPLHSPSSDRCSPGSAETETGQLLSYRLSYPDYVQGEVGEGVERHHHHQHLHQLQSDPVRTGKFTAKNDLSFGFQHLFLPLDHRSGVNLGMVVMTDNPRKEYGQL